MWRVRECKIYRKFCKFLNFLTSRSKQLSSLNSQVILMPVLDGQHKRIIVLRMIDQDPKKAFFDDFMKLCSMFTDTQNITPDSSGLCEGEICVYDFKGFSVGHLWNITKSVSSLRVFLEYVQGAIPNRVSQVHFVNCSPIFGKFIKIIRPFLKKEIVDVLQCHSNGHESLHEFVSKDFLPLEYGGVAGTCEKLHRECYAKVVAHNDYLGDDRNWTESAVIWADELNNESLQTNLFQVLSSLLA